MGTAPIIMTINVELGSRILLSSGLYDWLPLTSKFVCLGDLRGAHSLFKLISLICRITLASCCR
jgi:hypothetical protein